ncbi:hypothetical protein BHE74_00024241 [Ensete ventricosum]|nr:hypothetical protein BHE74_00024241 [Ensete ventricosum]
MQCPLIVNLSLASWKIFHFCLQNWASSELLSKMQLLAGRRKLQDLTIGPVLTVSVLEHSVKVKVMNCTQVTTESMLKHIQKLLKIPGSELLFGGEELENHSIPKIYGALKPTAVFVPLAEILKPDNFELVTKEIFGPFQVNVKVKRAYL